MIRACLSLARRIVFGPVLGHDPSLSFARMYGELTREYIVRRDPGNAYLLACRGFHFARIVLDEALDDDVMRKHARYDTRDFLEGRD